MNRRIAYVKDTLFIDGYFLDVMDKYTLLESADSGKSSLTVILNNTNNLCIEDFDNSKKCSFYKQEKIFGMQKSVDHIVFQNCTGACTLHLIEMKSTIGYTTFENIKLKVRSSYLNALAVASALGITISKVIAHSTYSQLKFDSNTNPNPRMYASPLGERAYDVKREEWDQNVMHINLGDIIDVVHNPIQMTKTDDGLTGTLILNTD